MQITWWTTLSGNRQWKDYKGGNSDPLGDIKDAIVGIRGRFGKQPNFVKTSYDILLVFVGHPDVVEIAPFPTPITDYPINRFYSVIFKDLFGIKDIEIDENMKDRMLIAYKENDEIYPDEKAAYEIRGIL